MESDEEILKESKCDLSNIMQKFIFLAEKLHFHMFWAGKGQGIGITSLYGL